MIKIKKYQIEDYISDATQDVLDLKADLVGGKVPASQLPSFVDDVIEVANYAALPIPGSTGVIYITLDTNKVYRWTGSVYVEIASGVTNLSYTPGVSDGTVNSDTGTDATIPLAGATNAGLFSAAEKTKLGGIAAGANVGVVPNVPITGATKTKITYDSKGLVTSGVDATTADIADSTNKRYVTDANLVVIGNTSGTNTGDQDLQDVTNLGANTTNPITVNVSTDIAIQGVSINGTGVKASTEQGVAIELSRFETGIGIISNQSSTSTGDLIQFNDESLGNIFRVNSIGDTTAAKFIKLGASPDEILAGDGSVIVAGSNINISDGIISSTGGSGGGILHANASGTDTYTATISGVTSYVDGDAYLIRFTNGNTTVCTLNINGLGVIPLYRNNDGPLIGGDIQNSGEMLCVYNSTANTFQCIGTSPNSIISYVTNDDSVTITKGQAVYAFSGQGDRVTVKRAFNTSDSTSAQTIGIVMSTSIGVNQKGFIMMQGLLDNLSTLPTTSYADGSPVYLGATAGSITSIKPYAPNHLVYLGIVTTASNGSAGRMYVRVQNGYELDELHNVQAQTPTFKDTLYYDNTVSPAQWKTASISSVLGYTPGTVSSVAALTLGTTGTDLSSTVATGTTTPVITLNVPNASATARGVVTTGIQTFAGVKTFSSNPKIPINSGNSGIGGIVIENGAGQIEVATNYIFPNLTELALVKGVTGSSIQTQINAKGIGTVTSVTASSPLSVTLGTTTPAISIPQATTSVSGYLSSTDWNTFNNKQDKSLSAYSMVANNTASSANATSQVFRNEPSKAYTGAITPTASVTAPSGATNHTYSWCQVGNLVTIRLNLDYASAGNGVTSLACMLPSDCPTPEIPSGVTTALNVISYGVGTMSANKASVATMGTAALRLKTTGPNTFDIQIQRLTGSYATAYATIQYFV